MEQLPGKEELRRLPVRGVLVMSVRAARRMQHAFSCSDEMLEECLQQSEKVLTERNLTRRDEAATLLKSSALGERECRSKDRLPDPVVLSARNSAFAAYTTLSRMLDKSGEDSRPEHIESATVRVIRQCLKLADPERTAAIEATWQDYGNLCTLLSTQGASTFSPPFDFSETGPMGPLWVTE